jgi:hypothetical protein
MVDELVERYSAPQNGIYSSVTTLGRGDSIRIEALGSSIAVSDILRPAR